MPGQLAQGSVPVKTAGGSSGKSNDSWLFSTAAVNELALNAMYSRNEIKPIRHMTIIIAVFLSIVIGNFR
jgi:hypothetical protein